MLQSARQHSCANKHRGLQPCLIIWFHFPYSLKQLTVNIGKWLLAPSPFVVSRCRTEGTGIKKLTRYQQTWPRWSSPYLRMTITSFRSERWAMEEGEPLRNPSTSTSLVRSHLSWKTSLQVSCTRCLTESQSIWRHSKLCREVLLCRTMADAGCVW